MTTTSSNHGFQISDLTAYSAVQDKTLVLQHEKIFRLHTYLCT